MKYFFFFVLVAITYACQNQQATQNSSTQYNDYKLKTSGAGEALDAWSFERTFPNDRIPSEVFLSEYQKLVNERTAARSSSDEWESLGPENIGGRTLCLAFHPTDTNTLYAGTASGGLWKTSTMGVGRDAWEPIETGFPVIGVGAVIIDPRNPQTIYIGTGETYHNFRVAEPGIVNRFTRGTYGIGILKTTDGGQTWEQILSFNEEDLVGVQDMEFNLQNPDEIYAATSVGLYQTKDGGVNWELIHQGEPIIDVEIDPNDGDVIYVSQGALNTNLDPNLNGLFKSTDKGESFTELFDDGLLDAWSGNGKISILPGNSRHIVASLQVGFFNQGLTTPGGLFLSEDGGENWNRIDSTNVAFWQGWYSHDIAYNPNNSSEMIYVGLDAWKSTQGGINPVQKTIWQNWVFGKVSVDEPEGPDNYVHADIHAAYYHPLIEDYVFLATDGGVFRSTDGGETWETCNGGLQTTQFYPNFATSTTDPNLALGGTQDNATYVYDGTDSWSRIIGGDGMSAAINPFDDNVIYGSAQNLYLARSDNRGDSFFIISPPSMTNEATAFAGPYELAPSQPNVVYAGRQFMYRSDDGGNSWNAVSTSEVDGGNVIINIAVSPINPDKLYVSTSPNPFGGQPAAKLFRSEDGGVSWASISSGLPRRITKDIAIDPLDDNIVYAVFSGFGSSHFARSTDGGESWETTDELSDVPTNTVLIDPLRPSDIYVGNDLGVFYSSDAGETWEDFSEGLIDATMVAHLSLSPANRKIRVATHGRGIYERDMVYQEPSSLIDLDNTRFLIELSPNPAKDYTVCKWNNKEFRPLEAEIYDLEGRLMNKTKLNEFSIQNSGEFRMDLSNIKTGNYLIHLRGEKSNGVTRLVKQ